MKRAKEPLVYIILLNWNGWEDTVECISSLKQLTYSNFEIIVVDNASDDNSVHEIQSRFPELQLIENEKNMGFAAGNNVGIKYALRNDADYVWLLNNDTVVESHALSPLIEKMQKNPSIGICGSKLVYYHQRDTIQVLAGGSYNKWIGVPKNFGQYNSVDYEFDAKEIERNLDFIIGASMLVSKDFINEVGLLDEEYFLYYEEIDWGIRAEGKFRLGFASESIVYHKEGASTKATVRNVNNKSRLSDYYHIKNRLKLTYKFYPLLLPFVYLASLVSILNRIKRNQWDRIPMIIKLFFTFNK